MFRCTQAQCRKCKRRIGGGDGGECTASDEIEIAVIPRPLHVIDNRIRRGRAHAISAYDMSGTEEFQSRLFARRPLEGTWIVAVRLRCELVCTQASKDRVSGCLRGGKTSF